MTDVGTAVVRPATLRTSAAVRRVASRFRPHRGLLLASAALVLVSVALSMIWPLLLKEVINTALPQHRTRLLATLCLAMIAAGALSIIFLLLQGAVANTLGQAVVHELRAEVYDRVQNMPLPFFSAKPNSAIQALLASDIGGISDVITFSAQGFLAAIVSLLAASLVMLWLSWPLALISLLLGFMLNVLNTRFARKRNELARARQEKVSEMLQAVGEDLTLPGVLLGRTLRQSAAQRDRFLVISGQISRLTRQQRLAGGSARAMIGVTLACLPPAIYWLSGTLVPGLSLGAVVVLSTLQMRLSNPIQQLLSLNGELQASLAMFNRVFNYLDLEPMRPPIRACSSAQPAAACEPMVLQARRLSYRYPDSEHETLAGIDLTVRPGTTTVIAGPSGSGKSTLALLLSGLLTPDAGTVELNGRPATPAALCNAVTMIAQEGMALNASLRDNLLFAKPDATDAELHEVVAAAELTGLIGRLGGLDAIVGERGYQLSGGERQRMSMARALLTDSPILVADEATSALDMATAASVHQSLRKRARSGALVMITHRIPRLNGEDQVVIMENGRITDCGYHADLLHSNADYAHMLPPSSPELGMAHRGIGQ